MLRVAHKKDVLIEREKFKKETESGIIFQIRDSFKDRNTKGKVVAIGKKVKDIHIGDIVFWDIVKGHDFEYEGKEYTLIRSKDILGKEV